jgi:cell wall-associated NlpC family hydrolase
VGWHDGAATSATSLSASEYAHLLAAVGERGAGNAIAEAATARARLGETEVVAANKAGVALPPGGVLLPAGTTRTAAAAGGAAPGATRADDAGAGGQLPPVGTLYPADLFVVAAQSLPAAVVTAIAGQVGVTAIDQVDAARLDVNGTQVATLGVDPATFRQFAASPTATSTALWQNVANGAIVVSYPMGQQLDLPLGGTVTVAGSRSEKLSVGGFGTVGINGVDAVVSDSVASSLGLPTGNGLVVSAPAARLSELMSAIKNALPPGAAVVPLVAQAPETGQPVTTGAAGGAGITTADGPGLSATQTRAFMAAAVSRVGMEYVWGGAGPTVFDCSGLVQWSMRQAGIAMPRVAADQALTGPSVAVADLQPGDLLFYHTDPTAPDYISHVAIYLGEGLMIQAPEPGKTVEVVPADFGAGFAGAVQVYPRVAAALAGDVAG